MENSTTGSILPTIAPSVNSKPVEPSSPRKSKSLEQRALEIGNSWEAEYEATKAKLKPLTSTPNILVSTQRVSQLDAQTLDDELGELLHSQFSKIFSLTTDIWQKYEAELRFGLDSIIYYISIGTNGASYGQQLQNITLQLSKEPSRRRLELQLLFALSVLAPYLWKKAQQRSSDWVTLPPDDPKKKAWTIMARIESTLRLLAFANFVYFLYDGSYPTLVHRVLQLRFAQAAKAARTVSFEFMNRQLLWNGFADFMVFMTQTFPGSGAMLMNSFTSSLSRVFRVIAATVNYLRGTKSHSEGGVSNGPISVSVSCPICEERSVMVPYGLIRGKAVNSEVLAGNIGCSHRFCYTCLQQRLSEGSGKCSCPLDGAILTSETVGRVDLTKSSLI